MRIGSKSRPPDYGNRGLTHTILDLRSVVCYLYEDAAHQLVVTSRLSGGCTFIINGFRMGGLSPQPVFASTASKLHNLMERGSKVNKAGSASDPLWYKDAVIYELHVRAFADSNKDGIGDFAGLIGKLDYLQDLGVTCLWLLPFYPSPLRDDGYDISDYTNVHPNYGSLDDFRQFLDAAHQRGMQVLIELVLNHTSDQHQWFQRSRHAPPGSVERDFYVWSDTDDLL